jgi:hypothetical protein
LKMCSNPVPEGEAYPLTFPCSTDADCPPSPHPCMEAYCGLFYCAESYAGDGQPDVCGPGQWCEEQTPDDFTQDVACCDEPPRCISLYDRETKVMFQCANSDAPAYLPCEGDHDLCVVENANRYACCR